MSNKLKPFGEALSVPERVARGTQSKLLLENDVFLTAINSMYLNLTAEEDSIAANISMDEREAGQHFKRLARMRAMLVELSTTLDHYVLDGENALAQQEAEQVQQQLL